MDPLPPAVPAVGVKFSLLRFIHDRNPFFPLSALCMFIGYRIVLGAIDSAPGDLRHLLGLIVTLNVYEAMLIALGLFVIVRRGLERDGWILLSIEALFLVDLTNLNAEFFTASPRLGSVVNGVCFLLALLKIFVVVRTLKLKLSAGTAFYIAMQLALLFALPGLFRSMSHHGAVSALQIYGVWWVVALLTMVGVWLVRARAEGAAMTALPWRLYVAAPLVSLIVHLCGENRVYAVHFHVANVSPILLAAALAMLVRGWKRRHAGVAGGVILLCFIAVCASVMPDEYAADLRFQFIAILSPLRLALIATAMLTLASYVSCGSWVALEVSIAATTMAGLGADEYQMKANAARLVKWAIGLMKKGAPTTALQWGYFTIAAAFGLLGVGAVFSLRKKSEEKHIASKLAAKRGMADNAEV